MLWIMRGVRSCLSSGRIESDCDNCIVTPDLQWHAQGITFASQNTLPSEVYSAKGKYG